MPTEKEVKELEQQVRDLSRLAAVKDASLRLATIQGEVKHRLDMLEKPYIPQQK